MNKFVEILQKHWGYSKFRDLQEDIISSVVNDKKDTLALLPTGGGKSVLYQVSGMAIDGVCLVVTPLIALMKDQVENLKRHKIPSVAIYTGLSGHEIDIIIDNAKHDFFKFLYISPERLSSEKFRKDLQDIKVSLIAVDEAHCISQWGYDFRPSYVRIIEIREMFPDAVVLAVTATATKDVVADIQVKLGFKQANVFKKSFVRDNLIYVVRKSENKLQSLLQILQKVEGSSVVYVRNRMNTKEISDFLNNSGMSSDYFHAGLDPKLKSDKQDEWTSGKTRVIVATNAFGMGIDKPDVRTVVHIDLPDNIEAYFQEAGRAGRDGKKAYAILLYNENDKLKLKRRFNSNYPEIDYIKRVYEALGNFFSLAIGSGIGFAFPFDLQTFCSNFKFELNMAFSAIQILKNQGYIEFTEDIRIPSRLMFRVNKNQLYDYQIRNADIDDFIKTILRTYSGVFTVYTFISEELLARRAVINVQKVRENLLTLSKMKIITYIPKLDSAYIIYVEPRLDANSLGFSKEIYHKRKELYETKLLNILIYAESTVKCRSLILLNYFGDESAQRCGKCDICLSRNELDLSKYEFDKIVDEIKKIIPKESNIEKDDMAHTIANKGEKFLKVFNWLLDNEKIRIVEGKYHF